MNGKVQTLLKAKNSTSPEGIGYRQVKLYFLQNPTLKLSFLSNFQLIVELEGRVSIKWMGSACPY